jgi:hypothetical protein
MAVLLNKRGILTSPKESWNQLVIHSYHAGNPSRRFWGRTMTLRQFGAKSEEVLSHQSLLCNEVRTPGYLRKTFENVSNFRISGQHKGEATKRRKTCLAGLPPG